MALENVVADGGFVTGFNGALFATADHLARMFQDAEVGPLALQLVHACAAAGAGIVLAGVSGSPSSSSGSPFSKLDELFQTDNRNGDEEASLGLPEKGVSGLEKPASLRFQEDFTCLGRLGRGAFGEVWRCRDHKDSKEYAVKAVRYRVGGASTDTERRASREVQMLSSVNHPNILRYYRSWVEVDENSCGGDGKCHGPASPWASPTFQPTASPPFASLASEPAPSDLDTDGFTRSYDGGSCGSAGVVFEGTQDEDPCMEASFATGRPLAASIAGADGHRCISSGWTAESANVATPMVRQTSKEDEAGATSPYTATLFIQVELCREETLQGWIASRNAAGRSEEQLEREARSILSQCTRALAHLHERSCVHRDVKPSNILFAQDGSIRLGDFGLAKAVGDETSPEAPQTGSKHHAGSRQCSGTPSYASPEQRAGAPLGVATDVYSLGLVLVELICPVQTQMERAEVLERLRENREVPSTTAASCQKLAQLAVWMTEPEPSKRPMASEILSFIHQAQKPSTDTAPSAAAAKVPSSLSPTSTGGRTGSTRPKIPRGGRCLRRRCSQRSSQQSSHKAQQQQQQVRALQL
jgi:serine/threonine protein kinase